MATSVTTSNKSYLGDGNPDGIVIGQSSTELIGFYGAAPVDKAGSTEDLKDLLVAYGLMTDGGATPLNLDSGAFTAGTVTGSTSVTGATITATTLAATDQSIYNDLTFSDAGNIILQTTTGTKIGTGSTQKLGFLGATPVARQGDTTDLKDLLVSFGLITDSGATPLNLDGGDLTCLNIGMANDMTITDAGNVILATSTGSQIGTASTQKLGFLGATPVTRQATTADIKDTLVSFGLIADAGASPLNLDGGALASGSHTLADGSNIITGTTTGMKIGTATSQKIGFFNATPITQTTLAAAAIATTGAISTTTEKWGYSTSTQANAIVSLANEVRALIVALGLSA